MSSHLNEKWFLYLAQGGVVSGQEDVACVVVERKLTGAV